jgi:hypothetical protein
MNLKLLITRIIFFTLFMGSLAHAGIAIDGNEYKNTIAVTPENYTDVEAEVNFQKWVSRDAMNKLFRLDRLTPAGPALTIRMNRDTLYSAALVDATDGFKVHMPDQGVFTSVLIIDQKGYSQDYIWQPGTHKIEIDKINGIFVWVLFRTGLEKGMEKAIEAQKTVGISGMGSKVWKAKPYDKAQYKKLHDMYMQEAIDTGLFMQYGHDASRIDMKIKRMADAAGWGGMDFGINSYQISKNMSSDQCYSTTFEDPKADEFWSFTLYDADGWLLPIGEKNILSSRDAVPNKDGTYTIRFNCSQDAVNNLETSEPEFGFAWRVYGSPYKVRAGRWNPIKSLVKE